MKKIKSYTGIWNVEKEGVKFSVSMGKNLL